MKNKFLAEMNSRGYLSQCTDFDKLQAISDKKSISAYIGFDCTAKSLHVGSLLQIMILKMLQKYGRRPMVLLGGGTTLIGDPSGKDSTRKILEKKGYIFKSKSDTEVVLNLYIEMGIEMLENLNGIFSFII